MSKKVDEQMTTGDVQTYELPLAGDMMYRNSPCFKISKKELRNMIHKNILPERVEKFLGSNSGDVYVKHENGIVFNARKFKSIKEKKNGKR